MSNFRRSRGNWFAGFSALFLWCGLSVPAHADLVNVPLIGIQVDENCDGVASGFAGVQPLTCSFLPDPGPGGLAVAMTYNLLNPPGLVAGDIVLNESGTAGDVLRFNPNQNGGSLVFYSAQGGGDPADVGLPTSRYTDVLSFNEVTVSPGVLGLVYTPTAGQPGFVAGAAVPVQYTFVSDTPEPVSFFLLGTVAALLCVTRWRARVKSTT